MKSSLAAESCYVTHLECPRCLEVYETGRIQTTCLSCGGPLLVKYNLEALAAGLDRIDLYSRKPDMWRYREFLPVPDMERVVSLGETMTPIIEMHKIGADLGMERLFVKDEGRLPTGSFKARGLSMAVTMAAQLGIKRVTIPTAGNAGGALAAYGARAGMEVFVFCPDDAPEINTKECSIAGAVVCLVNGLIDDCGRLVHEGSDIAHWFDMSTLREPYRIEGKKTMGLELAEQFRWDLPDVIFYPTGGGTGLIGMWKAFDEMEAVGWIGSERPRLIAVQAEGCAPIVRAFEEGSNTATRWDSPQTIAAGIRVPFVLGDFLILAAIRATHGTAIAVSDDEIIAAQKELAQNEGVVAAPEGAATLAGLKKCLGRGDVAKEERVLLFNTGSGLKYPMHGEFLRIDKDRPVDFERILRWRCDRRGAS